MSREIIGTYALYLSPVLLPRPMQDQTSSISIFYTGQPSAQSISPLVTTASLDCHASVEQHSLAEVVGGLPKFIMGEIISFEFTEGPKCTIYDLFEGEGLRCVCFFIFWAFG
jgi:hypothetical protein